MAESIGHLELLKTWHTIRAHTPSVHLDLAEDFNQIHVCRGHTVVVVMVMMMLVLPVEFVSLL